MKSTPGQRVAHFPARVRSFQAGGGAAAWTPETAANARGVWYADDYQLVAGCKRTLPNAVTVADTPVSTNLFAWPRRCYGGGSAMWNPGGFASITPANATAPDGSTDASTLVVDAGGAGWRLEQYIDGLPNGTYTMGAWVRLASGSGTFKFVQPFGTPQESTDQTPTGTWQRFSWTFTQAGGYRLFRLIGPAATCTLEIVDVTLYPGAVDLGSESLAGHLSAVRTDNWNTHYAGGLWVMSDGGVSAVSFADRYSTDAITILACVRPEAGWDGRVNPYKAWISNYEDDSLQVGNSVGGGQGNAGIDIGPLGGGTNSRLGQDQTNPFLLDREGHQLAVFAHTWDRASQVCDGWVNGVKLLTKTSVDRDAAPGFADFFINWYAHSSHPGYHSYYALAIYDRVLSDAEIGRGTEHIQARCLAAGNDAAGMPKILLIEGDQVAQLYPYTATADFSPMVRGADYTSTNATIAQLAARASRIAGVVAQAPAGTDVFVHVDVGRWEMGMGTGGSAATLTALAAYCDSLRTAGCLVTVATMIACQHSDQVTFDADRALFNAGVVTWVGVHCDAVVDLAVDADLGPDGSWSDATYFEADGIRLKQAGADIAAALLVTAVDGLP